MLRLFEEARIMRWVFILTITAFLCAIPSLTTPVQAQSNVTEDEARAFMTSRNGRTLTAAQLRDWYLGEGGHEIDDDAHIRLVIGEHSRVLTGKEFKRSMMSDVPGNTQLTLSVAVEGVRLFEDVARVNVSLETAFSGVHPLLGQTRGRIREAGSYLLRKRSGQLVILEAVITTLDIR